MVAQPEMYPVCLDGASHLDSKPQAEVRGRKMDQSNVNQTSVGEINPLIAAVIEELPASVRPARRPARGSPRTKSRSESNSVAASGRLIQSGRISPRGTMVNPKELQSHAENRKPRLTEIPTRSVARLSVHFLWECSASELSHET